MKRITIFLIMLLGVSLANCDKKVSVEDLKRFVATEKYPNDVFLDTVQKKRALVIVAHDDDDCAMSGTIAKLTAKGWAIKQLSLQSHVSKKTGKNPADIICQGNELILKDGNFRSGLDTMKNPYLPMSYEKIKELFFTNKVAAEITKKITDFRPSVLFTLDNVKGGYGHPEHIFISQLIKDLFEGEKIKTERIYQAVFTPHMENEIVYKWLDEKLKNWGHQNPSKMANELYGISGMPEPTVQVEISKAAQAKMNYLRGYEEDVRKNIRKFIPYYEEFDANTYFKIFDKEFFRVIEKPKR